VTLRTAPPTPAARTTSAQVSRIAFFGDSLAVNLGDAGRKRATSASPRVEVASDGISGCGVARSGDYRLGGRQLKLSPICAAWPRQWEAALERDRPKVVVIQVGRHEVLDRQLDGEWTNILEPTYAAYVRDELDYAAFLAAADGRKVVLLTAPFFHAAGTDRPEDDPARVARFNELVVEVAAARQNVYAIDLGARSSPDGAYADVVDGIRIRADGVHYSAAGAAWAIDWLLPQLAPLLGEVHQ
jgi:lysophospholipase L1-like esterase